MTDHVGRLASYSHYLFLFLCRLHQKLQLTKHLWLKSHHEYIFILASSTYFIEYVTWLVSKIFEYVDNVKCYCDRILNCKGFFNTAASFVKVIKKKLSGTKKNSYGGALAYLLGACLPVAGAFSFPSWRLRVEVSSQLLSTIVLQKNNCGADDI